MILACQVYDIDKINLNTSKFPVNSEGARVKCKCYCIVLVHRPPYAWYNVDIINGQFVRLFCQTNEFARSILYTNIMYLRLLKVSTFWRKWGDLFADVNNYMSLDEG